MKTQPNFHQQNTFAHQRNDFDFLHQLFYLFQAIFLFKKLKFALFFVLSIFLIANSLASTTVSGTLSTNTTWSASQSPYLVLADVIVDNNATLNIETGVRLQFAKGASLIIKKGVLQAIGNAQQPILMTAHSSEAVAGDWGQLRFGALTGASTILQHVKIEFGSGVVIEKSSPVLNDVAIENHSGAAIRLDLESSPIGKNLSARGNTLNAIQVLAGTVRSNVVWGLVGIPYLVQRGLVEIGQAPLAIEPNQVSLSPGVVALLRVSLNAPAPVGGLSVDLSSSVPSVSAVPSRLTVAAGETSADLEIQAVALGQTVLTASHPQLGLASAKISVLNLPNLQLLPNNPTIGLSTPLTMNLRLPQIAPQGGVLVQLNSANPQTINVPSSVFVPAGVQNVAFEVRGLQEGQTNITAQAEGYTSVVAGISVRGRALVLPKSAVVAPNAEIQLPVALTEPAPLGGLTVSFSSSPSGVLNPVAAVSIPEGQSSVNARLRGLALGQTQLQASASNYQTASTTIQVDSINLDFEPTGDLSLLQEATLSRRVRLSKPAPVGGVWIRVNSSLPETASVSPSEVFVPEAQTIATQSIVVRGLQVGRADLQIAADGLTSKTVAITVREKASLSLSTDTNPKKVWVGKGFKTHSYELLITRSVGGSYYSGNEPLTVRLKCVDAQICSISDTATIPANQYHVYVPVTGINLGSTQITASADNTNDAAPISVQVVNLQVVFQSLDNNRTTANTRDNFSFYLNVPNAYYNGSQTPIVDLTARLSLVEQNPQGLVNGIYDAGTAGNLVNQVVLRKDQSTSTTTFYVGAANQAGTYKVGVEIDGLLSGQSAAQTVQAANYKLSLSTDTNPKKVWVGKGFKAHLYELLLTRLVNGVNYNGNEPLTVRLKCVDVQICATTETVTIPAGQYHAYVPVTGLDIGSTQITASADGFTDATIPVEVITPQVVFQSLDNNRTTANTRDNFSFYLNVPNAYYNGSQTPIVDLTARLSLVEQNPQGLVNGIYDAGTAGNLVNQVVLRKDQSTSTTTFYVGAANQAGTYKVGVEIDGLLSGQSAAQTVQAANYKLSLSTDTNPKKVWVGKGFKAHLYELLLTRLVNGVNYNGNEPLTVRLKCVDVQICATPETVTIPAGQYHAYVPVTGLNIGTTQITASADGFTDATIPVEVITPQVVFQYLDNNRTTANTRDDFRFYLNVPNAYYSGSQTSTVDLTARVSLVEQNPQGLVSGIYDAWSAGNLLTQVTLSANQNTATNIFYVGAANQAGTYKVGVEIDGLLSGQSAAQTVQTANYSLTLSTDTNPKKVWIGKGLKTHLYELLLTRLVNGANYNANEDLVVNLNCVATSICSVPATVTIPAGQYYVYVPVTGLDFGATVIQASAANYTSASGIEVEVVKPRFLFSGLPSSIQAGNSTNFSVYSSVPNAYYGNSQTPASPITVTFSSAVPSVATVQANATWAVNSNYSSSTQFKGISAGTTTITVSAPDFEPTTSSIITVQP